MAKPWAEVQSSEQYQALPPQAQEAARQQYFNDVVAPQVPAASLDVAKQQFDTQTAAPEITAPAVMPAATPMPIPVEKAPEPEKLSTSVQKMMNNPMEASSTLDNIIDGAKRGAGLAARSVGEGLASLPLAAADLAAYPVNAASRALVGHDVLDSYQQTFRNGLTELGLPLPESEGEQLGSAIGRGAAGAAGGLGAGQLMREASSPVVAGIGDTLAASPGAQTIAGASSGGSGELARQEGIGPNGQLVAAVAGGLGGGLAARNIDSLAPQAPLPSGAATSGAGAEALRKTTAQAETVAQQGAEKIGLHWDSLDDNLKDQLIKNAEQATIVGSDLAPEALARKAVYESLGIKPTKALITRNFADALNEQNLLTEPEGQALRNIYAENNQAIRSKLQNLQPEDASPTDMPTFGAQFRAPIAEGERAAQKASNEAYTAAQAAEGGNPVNITKLNDYLQQNVGVFNNRTPTSGLIDDFRQMGLLKNEASSPEMGPASPQFTLQKLAAVRAATNDAWTTAKNTGDAVAANRLSSLRNILDDMESESGGELYNAYRKIRTGKGAAYENNPLIDKLLSDQKGYYGTAAIEDSDVFNKAVLNSSTEQFGKVWPQLTVKAQDLTRAQLGKFIEDKTFGNMGMNERGDIVASAAKLNQALTSINPQKLQLIYGKEKAAELEKLNTAVREISSPPRGTVPQGSAPKLVYRMNLLMKGLGLVTRIPFAGDIAKAIGGAAEKGAAKKASEAALNPLPAAPAEAAASSAESAAPLIAPAVLNAPQPGIIAPLLPDRNNR